MDDSDFSTTSASSEATRIKMAERALSIKFRLLAELMKFNATTFNMFNQHISGSEFESFTSVIVHNLRQSNIFVRCLLLSIERFTLKSESQKTAPDMYPAIGTCKLAQWLEKSRVALLGELMVLVKEDAISLSEENPNDEHSITPVNTALVFFFFAHLHRQMPQYLSVLRKVEQASGQPLASNFLSLLRVWRRYYNVPSNLMNNSACSAGLMQPHPLLAASASALTSDSRSIASCGRAHAHKPGVACPSAAAVPVALPARNLPLPSRPHTAPASVSSSMRADLDDRKQSLPQPSVKAKTGKITLGELLEDGGRSGTAIFCHHPHVRCRLEADPARLESWSSIPFTQWKQLVGILFGEGDSRFALTS
jgi:hypothetical protein